MGQINIMKICSRLIALLLPILLGACQQGISSNCPVNDLMASHYKAQYQKIADLPRHKSRPGKKVARIAQRYKVETMDNKAEECSSLLVQKELKLALPVNSQFRLLEINDYYTRKGKRIARYQQDLTNQLTESGYYLASDPLPIPGNAVKGRYTIKSTLVLKKPNKKKPVRLARSSTRFRIN